MSQPSFHQHYSAFSHHFTITESTQSLLYRTFIYIYHISQVNPQSFHHHFTTNHLLNHYISPHDLTIIHHMSPHVSSTTHGFIPGNAAAMAPWHGLSAAGSAHRPPWLGGTRSPRRSSRDAPCAAPRRPRRRLTGRSRWGAPWV